MNYAYIHNYSPVLDRTVWSSPTKYGTGPDCGPKGPDRMVRSFLRSTFSSDKKTGLYGPVSLKWDRTPVWGCWTVQSSLFQQSPKKAMVRTGPDRGQSSPDPPAELHPNTNYGEDTVVHMGRIVTGVVVDKRILYSTTSNSVRQLGYGGAVCVW